MTTPEILSCEHCGAKFEPARARGGRPIPTKWCSRACQQAAYRERHDERIATLKRTCLELRAENAELRRRLA